MTHQAAIKQIHKFVDSNLAALCKEVTLLDEGKSVEHGQIDHLERSLIKAGLAAEGSSSQRLARALISEAAVRKVARA
jgi:ABC-type uncharacterized transport system ATPase subunit